MAPGSVFSEEQEKRHNRLLNEINDHVDRTSKEYAAFKRQVTEELGGADALEQCEDLFSIFRILQNRGKLGILKYDVLKKAFKASNNENIVQLIEEKEEEIRKAGDPEKPTNKEDVDPSDGKFYQKEGLGYYQTDRKKGYLLILNFSKDRDSTEYDVSGLKKFFGEELKFDVNSPRDKLDADLTTNEMEDCLKKIRDDLSSNSMSEKYYCFMCAILSHGKRGIIKTKGGEFKIEEIRKMFRNEHMKKFAGKPKIFFIQTCQGSGTQTSVGTNDKSDDDDEKEPTREEIDESDVLVHIPNDADVLFAYATTPGFKSFRRDYVGSWFITECIEVFGEFKERCHLEDMMVTVRERVALNWEKKDGGKQMPCTWSTLTKRLRLR